MTEQSTVASGKAAALKQTISYISASFGKNAIRRSGELPSLEVLETHLPELDAALGVGGIPRGKIVEIYGPEAAGKTALALHIAKQAESALYIDAEHSLAPALLAGCGGAHLLEVETLEAALQAVMIASASFDVIVIDTLTALPPRLELNMTMGEYTQGTAAKILAASLPRLTAQLAKNGCTLVIVNQMRTNPTVMFGSPEKVPGGCALKHYAAMRLEVRRVEILKAGGQAIGQKIKVKTVKNKCAVPMREAFLALLFGSGLRSVERGVPA